jgi:hypothetical protein
MPDFPFIPQVYYSHPHMGTFPPNFPCVLKVWRVYRGRGEGGKVVQRGREREGERGGER